jgi:DnaJ-class molecular chaperone
MEFKDYYATLGVAKTATEKEIKQAYRKLARKHHPDVNPGDRAAEARFKEINEAYEVLGDPEKRKKYDDLGANWRLYEQAQQAYGAPGAPDGAWSVNVGGPGGFRTMTEEEVAEMFGDEGVFSDFFRTFFGGGAGGGAGSAGGRRRGTGRARRRAGEDVEQDIQLTLDDAFHGSMRRISIKRDGHTRTVDVRIPAGIKDGSRVRIPGEGEAGAGGGPPGDLYLRVRLAPHYRFTRKGQDLYVRVPVPVPTAVLGGEVSVPTIAGTALRLKVPVATQNGQVFRLRGQGMPAVGKPDQRGDLYATVDIQIPRTLTPEQRSHYEALARLGGDS